MSGLPDVTVVITAHDAGEALLTTVEEAAALAPAALLLIDSGSSDGSVEAVEAALSDLEVHHLPDNPGPCATRNLGLRLAKTPFVLFLDDDMSLEPGCIEALRDEVLRDETIALCGPSIWQRDAEGNEQVQYAGGAWNYAGLAHIHTAEPEETRDVAILTSGCVLARGAALEEARGFDETFFFLMEDVDLCLRLRALGKRLRLVVGARAWNRGASEGLSIQGREYPALRARLHARNRPLLLLSLYRLRSLVLLAPAILLLDCAWFGFALVSGRGGSFLRGRLALLKCVPAIVRRRRWWGRLRSEGDCSYLSDAPVTVTPAAARKAPVRRFLGILNGSLRVYWRIVRSLLR